MKKILIAVPPNLPMPPVKGGAIETLLQYVVDENEKHPRAELTIVSLFDSNAQAASNKYNYTKYIYFKKGLFFGLRWFFFRVIRKLFGKRILVLEPYEYFINKLIGYQKYDVFINESADFNSFRIVSNAIGRDHCYAHLHSRFSSNRDIDETFGTIICVSEYIKKEWLKTANIEEQRVKVLQNCVDEQLFSKSINDDEKRCLRLKYGFNNDDFIVVYCGRIVPEKGVLELITAINKIDDVRVKLLIIGSPNFGEKCRTNYLSQVESEVKKSNGKISFTGYVAHEQLYKYYQISNCAVVPSTYEDPAPLVPIESMMAGKALILTNSGGAPEYVNSDCSIIVDKGNSLSQNIADAIVWLRDHPARLLSMEMAAREQAKKFTTIQYYRNYMNIVCADELQK